MRACGLLRFFQEQARHQTLPHDEPPARSSPTECCRPNRGIISIEVLAAQGPVGTRGGVEWMRGPCACPRWGATCLLHAVPTGSRCPQDKHPTCPTSAPCPYRTGNAHYPIRSSTFIRTRGRLRPSHSRIWSSKFISYQEDWFGLAISCWHRQEQNAASLHPTNPRQDLSPGESLAAAGCAEYSRE